LRCISALRQPALPRVLRSLEVEPGALNRQGSAADLAREAGVPRLTNTVRLYVTVNAKHWQREFPVGVLSNKRDSREWCKARWHAFVKKYHYGQKDGDCAGGIQNGRSR